MNWIRIAAGMRNDPSIVQMADACNVRVSEIVGCVVAALSELPDHARDGNLTDISPRVLEQWAGWEGKRGRFAEAFFASMCEGRQVRSWEKHNGASLRKAEADIERKRAARRTDGAETARAGRVDGGAVSEVDETRRTNSNSKEQTDRSVQLPNSAAELRGRSVDQANSAATPRTAVVDPAMYAPQLAELTAAALPHEALALQVLMAQHVQPYALVLELHAVASGMHQIRGGNSGRTADIADVMRAVAEMAANGHPWSVKLFRGYVRRIADRPPEPATAEAREVAKMRVEIERHAAALPTRGERNAAGVIVAVPIEADDTPAAREARRIAREQALAEFRSGQRRVIEIDTSQGASQGAAA